MFKILKESFHGKARLGLIKTIKGEIKTPFFMPDATRGLIKFLSTSDLEAINVGPMVVNTYHLYLQPGTEIIKKAGGINNFMQWDKPLLSDSGGFQVLSLIHSKNSHGKVTDEKAIFRSPISGAIHEITPEKSIQIQFDLGVQMMVCFDDCPPSQFSRERLKTSIERTIKWAKRSKAEYLRQLEIRGIPDDQRPLLFGVIQGGDHLDLRKYCTDTLVEIGFDGYGFGAIPLDKEGNLIEDTLAFTAEIIPKESLRFALGIGRIEDIKKCFKMGWDMFDCVIPTREGRHGRLFLKDQNIVYNIKNSEFKTDFSKINPESNFPDLKKHTKAYLHHLFKVGDPVGPKLAALNNLEIYIKLMEELKKID